MGGTYRPWIVGYFQPVPISAQFHKDIKRSMLRLTEEDIYADQEPTLELKMFAAEVLVDQLLAENRTPRQIMNKVLRLHAAQKKTDEEKEQFKIKHQDILGCQKNQIEEDKILARYNEMVDQVEKFSDALNKNDNTLDRFTQKINQYLPWLEEKNYIASLFRHYAADSTYHANKTVKATLLLEVNAHYEIQLRAIPYAFADMVNMRGKLIAIVADLNAAGMNMLADSVAKKNGHPALTAALDTKITQQYEWSGKTGVAAIALSLGTGLMGVALVASSFLGVKEEEKAFVHLESSQDTAFFMITGGLLFLSLAIAICARPADAKGAQLEKAEFAKVGFKRTA